jgi:hypothetical protein
MDLRCRLTDCTGCTPSLLSTVLHWLHSEPTLNSTTLAALEAYSQQYYTGYTWIR